MILSTMMIQLFLFLSTVSLARGEISKATGLNWDDMPKHLIPDVDPRDVAAAAAAAAAKRSIIDYTQENEANKAMTPQEVRDLMEASTMGNMEEIQTLLNEGVDVNSVETRMGDTALHAATWANQIASVEFLLKQSADPNIKNLAGYTPLLLATRKETKESVTIMKTLLMNGAKPWATNNNGNNALHWAAHLGRLDVIEWLLGEDDLVVNEPNDDGLTPLMLAAKSGKEAAIAILIEKADANYEMVEPNFGRTPLEMACAKGNARVVQLLLKKGAVWKAHQDKLGNDALKIAKDYGHTQVEFLLEGRDPLTGEPIVDDEQIEGEEEEEEEKGAQSTEL